MKKRFVSIMMAITVIFSSVGSNNFIIYADDFSNEEDVSLDDGADITVDTEEPENTNSQLEETDISEEASDDENNPDITIEDDSEEDESEEDLEFSDSDELFTDSDEPEVFSAGTQNNSSTPEYDVWLSDTIVSGLKMNGTTYGNSMYKIFKEMQEPIYEELGELILGDVPMMSISSVWNNVIKREFYTNQKLIYETLLVEYIKYENKTNAEQFDTTQIDRTNAYLIKIFNELADGGPQDWASEQFMNMSVDEAIKSFENVQCMKDTIRRTKDISKNVKEFITFNANLLALEDAKREKVQLIKNARDACASMGNSNYDFITACNEIIEEIEKVDIDLHSYVLTQSANTAMKAVIDKVWSDLCEKNIVLKSIDWGADAMDILFNTSDAASNNLKLSILYTMDCYFKMGLSNAATSYLSHPTDKEAALTFNSCFDGYVNFQIYGNHTAKSWISSVSDDGALNHAFTYIFCREALKSAEELKSLCDSQNKTRNQILNIIDKYPDIYSNLYMKDEYKQALSVPVTPTPAINPKDYKISEGLSSPNPVESSGMCGDSAYWKLFKDGTLVIYGTGNVYKTGWENSKLKKVEITDGITRLSSDLFWGCNNLESFVMSNTITQIGEKEFFKCKKLHMIQLSSNLQTIPETCFYFCSSLEQIEIPNSVTEIGRGAFLGSGLKEISISDSVTKIGSDAFNGCYLSSITIPDSVTEIEEEAFNNCIYLTTVQLPSNMKTIPNGCFWNCAGLKNISIPNSVTEIGMSAFGKCAGMQTMIIPNGVKKIGKHAFEECDALEDIEISDSVSEIGEGIFEECKNLKKVRLSSNLKTIPKDCFLNCEGLENIEIPNSITEIGEYAFKNCKNLKTVRLSSGLNTISKHCFTECESLESIEIPDSVTEIGEDAFCNCKNMKAVKLSSNIKSVPKACFTYCEKIKSVVIPDGVMEIKDGAFNRCTNLKNIIIPDSVKKIGNGVFGACDNLESIELPNSVIEVGEYAFSDCKNLKIVKLSSSMKTIFNGCFLRCEKIESVIIPDSVTNIEMQAFEMCTYLKYIEIPNSVVEIGEDALSFCHNLSIHGHTGSYAEKYAKEHNIPFIDLDGKKDDVTVTPAVKPTVKPTATPQKPSTKPATREPAVLKLNVTAVTLQRKQSTTGLKITGMAKWDSVASWKSSNTKIVKVSKTGKLTAQNKTGKATVTVTLKSGLSKKVTVKVQKAPVGTIKITGLKKAVTLAKGKTLQLKPVRQPFTCREKITYTSSNKKVVSVNSKGKIKALKPGKAKITVKSGKKKVVITVTVKKK